MQRLGTLGVLLCLACAGPDAPQPQSSRQAIYGGVPSLDDEAVFHLTSTVGGCTASLIASRTLLTAQHCIEGGTALSVHNAPNAVTANIVAQRTFTEWRVDAGPADLALLLLDREPAVQPLVWNWWSTRVNPNLGQLRHIGYGLTENGPTAERRMVTLDITGTDPSVYGLGVVSGTSTQGPCSGDSGGPAMLVLPDGGPETLLAVHSHGYGDCNSRRVGILLPPYRRFVEEWLEEYEDAGCPRDHRCVAGCQPIDQDCACIADGLCSADCIDLDDPDCSPFCKVDGLCSLGPCALRDEDCNEPGQGCLRPAQCPGRECISDPQNTNKYCTQRCTAGLCPVGFQCDTERELCIKTQLPYVENGGACADGVNLCREFSQCLDGTCTALCSSGLDCPKNWFCRETYPRICVAKNVVLRPSTLEAPAAPQGGCQAAPAGPALLLLLMAYTTSRRRARTGKTAWGTCS